MVRRLQLGTSRLEALKPRALNVFLDDSWTHLGDPDRAPGEQNSDLFGRVRHVIRRHGIPYILKQGFLTLSSIGKRSAHSKSDLKALYGQTQFKDFYYEKGDSLPFESGSLDFVFSEHFLEHLFMDEALSLIRECHRVLKPSGVIRTCVPDADLRIYESPEPIGFPDRRIPFSDPSKHKTRWSVYSLAETLRLAGFEPVPLRYCDKEGHYVAVDPSDLASRYGKTMDAGMVFDLSYVMRIDSLIVDGVKRC